MNHIIEAHHLVKNYGKLQAVRDIDFKIKKGCCFGFLGPNGAGKSTTMGMLYGLIRPSNGRLTISGLNPVTEHRAIKKLMGIVPQDNNLDVDLSVIENLITYARYFDISKKESLPKINELLHFFELSDKRNVRISELSGGMQRRLILARAFLHNPTLVILDEPTTGLDPQARHLIWERLEKLKKTGTTFILTTHYMDEAERLCDELVLMDHGKILAEGTPNDLIHKHIGRETIEIRIDGGEKESLLEKLHSFQFTSENTPSRLFLYTNEGHKILEKIMSLNDYEFMHRQSSLEDVFLKLTGRGLRE